MMQGVGGREDDDELDNITSSTNLINNSNHLISKVANVASQQLLGNNNSSSNKNQPDLPFCGCLSITYYQPFFDVDTSDITKRLSHAMFYCRREQNFIDIISEKPDAYGPFWIATSLVFILAVTSHIRDWWIYKMSKEEEDEKWNYDFQYIISAFTLIYGFASIVPVVLWLILKQYDNNLKLITLICVYGYSLFIFIPTVLMCIIPSELLSWLILLASAIISSLFILRSLAPIIITNIKQDSIVILGPLGLTQVVLMICMKLMFFYGSK